VTWLNTSPKIAHSVTLEFKQIELTLKQQELPEIDARGSILQSFATVAAWRKQAQDTDTLGSVLLEGGTDPTTVNDLISRLREALCSRLVVSPESVTEVIRSAYTAPASSWYEAQASGVPDQNSLLIIDETLRRMGAFIENE
jgi:hypothetical protein